MVGTKEHWKYKLLENKIPTHIIEYLQEYTLELKNRIKDVHMEPKPNGSGIYWQGLDMASKCELSSDEENQKLYDVYTSQFMYDIITEYISEPYLFNDQVVVKLPNEEFSFDAHYDNQYPPLDTSYTTINCMLILDDFTEENGAIKVLDDTWIRLFPKKGDILMIDGNTLHSSEENKSDNVRRAYICVYSGDKLIGEDFEKDWHYERFSK